MDARLVLSLVVMGCAGCDSSSSSLLDGGADGRPDAAPPPVALGATCVGQGGDQDTASIGVDAQGNALVAWTRRVGQEDHIVTCSLRQGVWQAAEDIGAGTSPLVVLAGDGSGMLAWTEPSGGTLVAARYVDGQLGPPTAVPQSVGFCDLALLPDGDAEMLASGLELRSYHYDAQSDLWDPTPRMVPVSAATAISSPRLGATADGLIAVWQETDLATSQGSIRAARFNPVAAQWTSSSDFADVAPAVMGDQAEEALYTSPPGHALVVLDFKQSDVLSASAYDTTLGRWTPQLLQGAEPAPPLHSSGGMDASGRGWVTWAVQPSPLADFEIHGRRFAHGWGEPEVLFTSFYVASAVVTVTDAGKALLLWLEPGAPDMVLRAAIAEPDGTFGGSKVLLDRFLAVAGSLRIATGPNGHSVAAWLAMPGGMTAAVIDW